MGEKGWRSNTRRVSNQSAKGLKPHKDTCGIDEGYKVKESLYAAVKCSPLWSGTWQLFNSNTYTTIWEARPFYTPVKTAVGVGVIGCNSIGTHMLTSLQFPKFTRAL